MKFNRCSAAERVLHHMTEELSNCRGKALHGPMDGTFYNGGNTVLQSHMRGQMYNCSQDRVVGPCTWRQLKLLKQSFGKLEEVRLTSVDTVPLIVSVDTVPLIVSVDTVPLIVSVDTVPLIVRSEQRFWETCM